MATSPAQSPATARLPRANLHLVPRSAPVRELLVEHGHNPRLLLSVSPNKSMDRIIRHLLGKWTHAQTHLPLAKTSICLWPRSSSSRLPSSAPICSGATTKFGLPVVVLDLYNDQSELGMPMVIDYDWKIEDPDDALFEGCFEEISASPVSPAHTTPTPVSAVRVASSINTFVMDDENQTFRELQLLLSQGSDDDQPLPEGNENSSQAVKLSQWDQPSLVASPPCRSVLEPIQSNPVTPPSPVKRPAPLRVPTHPSKIMRTSSAAEPLTRTSSTKTALVQGDAIASLPELDFIDLGSSSLSDVFTTPSSPPTFSAIVPSVSSGWSSSSPSHDTDVGHKLIKRRHTDTDVSLFCPGLQENENIDDDGAMFLDFSAV